jgi:hypothetical protein
VVGVSRAALGTICLTLAIVSCGRGAASTPFQPTLEEAIAVARQRHAGDLLVFVCDRSDMCHETRREVFGATPTGRFVAANFAAVHLRSGSDAAQAALVRYQAPSSGPQIIVVSERLNNLRVHVLRLERIREQRLLEKLQAVKRARTFEEYRKTIRTVPARHSPPA